MARHGTENATFNACGDDAEPQNTKMLRRPTPTSVPSRKDAHLEHAALSEAPKTQTRGTSPHP